MSVSAVSSKADLILSGNAAFNPFKLDGTTSLGADQLVLVVVDKSRDSFSAGKNFGLTVGDDLSTFVGNADDMIIGRNVTSLGLGDLNVPGTASTLLGGGIDLGDPFGIYIFDGLGAGDTTVTGDLSYTFLSDPSWVLKGGDPSTSEFGGDAGEYFQFATGVSTSFSVAAVPEPSGFLLGGFLAFWALFTRRRPRQA